MEIIKTNLYFHFEKKEIKKFLFEEKNINVLEAIISKILNKIRETIIIIKYNMEEFVKKIIMNILPQTKVYLHIYIMDRFGL